jgi:hypothetical protein
MAFIVKKSYIPILDLQQNTTIPTLLSSAGSSQNYVFSTTDDIYFEAEVYLNSYADGNGIIEASSTTYGIVNEFSFQVIGENGAGETRLLPVGSFGIYNGTRGESLSIHYTDVAIIDLNTWTKVTAKRINGVWSLFINDIECSVDRFDDNGVPNDQFGNIALPVYIGRSEQADLNFDGQIRNIFLSKKNKLPLSLIIKKNTTFKIPRTPPFLPSSLGGLALWLKADAGVSKFSFNYISQIIITGTSNPSFAGTYTATTVPTYNLEDGYVGSYLLMGPEGKSMAWDGSVFVLSSSGEPEDSFSSTDGVNWIVVESYIYQIVISGFTGIYAGANGTYNGDGVNFSRVGGGFFINGNELKDPDYEIVIATAPANYSGSWTPTSYINSVTLAGAGTTSVNGVYTRTDSEIREQYITFLGSGGKNLYWNGDNWVALNADQSVCYYRSNFELINWSIDPDLDEGTAPAPTGSVGTSNRSVGSPTSTSSSKPTGSISGSGIITVTVNTDYVDNWADQSGNSIVLTPDNQNAPTFVSSFLNGKPAIEFIVGSNTGLSNTSFGLTGFTFFSVTKQKSTNTGRIFSSYFGNVLIGTWGNYSNRFYGGGSNGWLAEGEQTSTDFLITTAFSDANTSFGFYQNGILQSSGASNSTVILNGISVGGGIWNGGNEEASDSYVCEIVIYNRTLSLTERQQVEAYLNQKYQIY